MTARPTSAAAVTIVGETLLSPTSGFSVFKASSKTDRFLRGYNTHARDSAGWDVRGGGVGTAASGAFEISSNLTDAAAAAPSSAAGGAFAAVNPLITADIVASVSGLSELTESIVSVTAMSPRYHAEVGDVVVGRIIDVVTNRWRCEVFGLQDATMLIRNVTGPGSILRRRGREDELTMRKIFKEDDVFVAEVQRINLNDGTVSLHIRSSVKYGKRRGIGNLVLVRPALVPRMKQQFHVLVDKGPIGLFSLPSATSNNNNNASSSSHAAEDGSSSSTTTTTNTTSSAAAVGSSSSAITSDNAGVQVVFGVNGGIWVGVATPQQVLERKKEMAIIAAGGSYISNALNEDENNNNNNNKGGAGGEEEEEGADANNNNNENDDEEDEDGVNALLNNNNNNGSSTADEAVVANNHRMVAIVSNVIRLLNARRCLITPSAIDAALAVVYENSWTAFDIVKGGVNGDVADAIISAISSGDGGVTSGGERGQTGLASRVVAGGKRNRE